VASSSHAAGQTAASSSHAVGKTAAPKDARIRTELETTDGPLAVEINLDVETDYEEIVAVAGSWHTWFDLAYTSAEMMAKQMPGIVEQVENLMDDIKHDSYKTVSEKRASANGTIGVVLVPSGDEDDCLTTLTFLMLRCIGNVRIYVACRLGSPLYALFGLMLSAPCELMLLRVCPCHLSLDDFTAGQTAVANSVARYAHNDGANLLLFASLAAILTQELILRIMESNWTTEIGVAGTLCATLANPVIDTTRCQCLVSASVFELLRGFDLRHEIPFLLDLVRRVSSFQKDAFVSLDDSCCGAALARPGEQDAQNALERKWEDLSKAECQQTVRRNTEWDEWAPVEIFTTILHGCQNRAPYDEPLSTIALQAAERDGYHHHNGYHHLSSIFHLYHSCCV